MIYFSSLAELNFYNNRRLEFFYQVELVFLVDASSSVGFENFRSELNFVRKLLSDFTVEPSATRVAVVTFAGRRHIHRHIDQISKTEDNDQKCQLLNKQLSNVTYTGGGTYTRGALLEALVSMKKKSKLFYFITNFSFLIINFQMSIFNRRFAMFDFSFSIFNC